MQQHALESLESRRLLSNTASISGSVYDDVNANANHEASEAGLKEVRLYLDANNNGKWDSKTETSVLSDKRGQFRFGGLSGGTYRLREVTPAGYTVVGPRSGWFKMTLSQGQQITRRQFSNARAVDGGSTGDNDVVTYTPVTAAFRDFIALRRATAPHEAEALALPIAWLSGDKTVARTPWVQRVIDGYHADGIKYKREFLRLAESVLNAG